MSKKCLEKQEKCSKEHNGEGQTWEGSERVDMQCQSWIYIFGDGLIYDLIVESATVCKAQSSKIKMTGKPLATEFATEWCSISREGFEMLLTHKLTLR